MKLAMLVISAAALSKRTLAVIRRTLPLRALAALVLGAAISASGGARAAVILGNLPIGGGDTFDFSNALSTNNHKALSFSIGSQDYLLESILLRLSLDGRPGIPKASTAPVLELRNHSGDTDVPGTVILASFTPSAPVSGVHDEVLTPVSSFTLLSDTSYWIVVRSESAPSDSGLFWTASDPGQTPTGIVAFGKYRSSFDGGTSWNASTFQNSFEIRASAAPVAAVPAPPSLVLLALSLLGAGVLRNRIPPRVRR